jgi:hypothetical protein
MSTEHQEPKRWKRVLLWLFRAVSVSVILALCDCWSAGTARRDTVFSKTSWAMDDGGTRGYTGFGYFLTYYRRMDATLCGPSVWFWFTPFTVSMARGSFEVRWLWRQD